MHSPPNSTQGTVRIDLQNQRFSGETGGSERKEGRGLRTAELQLRKSTVYLPSIAIGEGEDVVLVILQTRDTACGRTTASARAAATAHSLQGAEGHTPPLLSPQIHLHVNYDTQPYFQGSFFLKKNARIHTTTHLP